ncbi:MAG: hypothetical protein SGJ02_08525 [bacterium]|nr:hypothetical protein [bacterium]
MSKIISERFIQTKIHLLIFLTLCTFLLGGCIDSGCEIANVMEVPSTSGKYIATIYNKECNATIPFNTHVCLTIKGEPFSPSNEQDILIMKDKDNITLSWLDDQHLKISIKSSQVYKSEKSWNDVSIEIVNEVKD